MKILTIKFKNGNERKFNLEWFNFGFDNENQEYILTALEDKKCFGFGEDVIINGLRINSKIVDKIEIL